jgi:hypothetical protein
MSTVDKLNATALGLFEKRIEGDDCLMTLARRRFLEAGMGAEMHAGSPPELASVMAFRPGEQAPVVVHLPRDLNLADALSRTRIAELAARFAGQISGLVIHDQAAMAARRSDYIEAAWIMDGQLERIDRCPMLFVEYAVGLEPTDFAGFFSAIPDLDRISACIDIGHVGVRAARAAYARNHPGEDICALKLQSPRLPQVIDEVEIAVASAAAAVFDLLEAITTLKKPVHFHLHDAHPLSTVSPFGVSDHLSFLTEIPLPFEHRGRRALPPMFGPAGLAKLVAQALEALAPRPVSFTLEIHPTGERLDLGDDAPLFNHWTDKTNAEKMNHWLSVLSQNHRLLQQAMQPPPTPEPVPTPEPASPEVAQAAADVSCGPCDI